jgi:hypothetical protein
VTFNDLLCLKRSGSSGGGGGGCGDGGKQQWHNEN